jgi:hypothetical protein
MRAFIPELAYLGIMALMIRLEAFINRPPEQLEHRSMGQYPAAISPDQPVAVVVRVTCPGPAR